MIILFLIIAGVFSVPLIIAINKPHVINKVIKRLSKSYTDKTKDQLALWFAVPMGICLLLAFGIYSYTSDKEAEKTKTPEQIRTEKIEKCFSPWNGEHTALTSLIKEGMNDPDSYDHTETRYIDKGDHLVVITSFRGKNAFGGVVKNSITAETDIESCRVIKIINQ